MADADAMAGACAAAGVVFAGGALTKAYPEVQEAAARLAAGVYGAVVGASVHGWSSEILGAGCQHTSVLRLLTGAEVTAVVAWCEQPDGLRDGDGRLVDAVDGAEVSLPHPPARVSALSDHCALWCMPSSCLWLRRPTGPCVLALLSRARMPSPTCNSISSVVSQVETGSREPVGADCTEFNAMFTLSTGLTGIIPPA